MDEVSGLPLYRGLDLALLLPAVALNLRPGEDVLGCNSIDIFIGPESGP